MREITSFIRNKRDYNIRYDAELMTSNVTASREGGIPAFKSVTKEARLAMKPTVRRVETALARVSASEAAIGNVEGYQPAVKRGQAGLYVTSEKCLGADPRVLLTWEVGFTYWWRGYHLMGFRSGSGFSPDPHPDNLSEHGLMILDETRNGSREERLPEGTHFYTFVLYKRGFLGIREYMSVLRFSETIPSAKTAIGRIEDQLKLQQLKEDCDLGEIKRQVARNDAIIALHKSNRQLAELTEPKPNDFEGQVRREVEGMVRGKLKKAMTRIELAVALQDVQKQLKRNSAWKRLHPLQREKILQEIIGDLDANEEFFEP